MRIKVDGISKRFNREWIFKNLNYEFKESETYAITGPNGSGKSTLLQVLWGQLIPSSGTVQFTEGENIVDTSDIYRHISIATPYMELIDEFTLHETLEFHFKFKKPKDSVAIPDIPDLMNLSQSKNKPLSNFSSGMRQRVKLGLAFFSASQILFLDEPTTNLDTKSIDWYLRNLEEIMKTRTVIIASNQKQEYPEDCPKIDITNYK